MQEAQSSINENRVSPLDDDILAMRFTNADLLKLEPELFSSKWFDYRMITPGQATRLYIQDFHDVYLDLYRTEIDRTAAQYVKPPSVESVFEGLQSTGKAFNKAKRLFASLWRGRQVADAMCMPYRLYIRTVMTSRLKYWQQRHLPQPHQLYGRIDVERCMAKWEEMQAGSLYLAEHSAYMVQNYADIAHQNDYHEWLFKQASLRSNPPVYLAQFVNDDLLPLDKVEARFDEDTLERIHRHIH